LEIYPKQNLKSVEENLENIIKILIEGLENPHSKNSDRYKLHCCNNSCWSIGIIAVFYSNKMRSFIDKIMEKLLMILCVPRLNKSVAQNISICIGRLAFSYPEQISKYLDNFVKNFCLSIRFIEDSKEKQEAFMGICKSIIANPQGLMNHFPYFCDAICQYENAPPELLDVFNKLIYSYKSLMRENWNNIFNTFPEKLQKKMIYRFKLNE